MDKSPYSFEFIATEEFSSLKFCFNIGQHAAPVVFDNIRLVNESTDNSSTTAFLEWQSQYDGSYTIGTTTTYIQDVAEMFTSTNYDTVYVQKSGSASIKFSENNCAMPVNDGVTYSAFDNEMITDDVYRSITERQSSSSPPVDLILTSRSGSVNWETLLDHPIDPWYDDHYPNDSPVSLFLNSGGDIIMAGYYLTDRWLMPNPASHEYVTVKYRGSDGSEIWKQFYDEEGIPHDMVGDNNSNIYVTGSAGTVKYNTNGIELCTCADNGTAIAVAPNGDFYVGSTVRVQSYDPLEQEFYWHDDIVLIKYNSSCQELWRTDYSQTSYDDFITNIIIGEGYVYAATRDAIYQWNMNTHNPRIHKFSDTGVRQWTANCLSMDMVIDDEGHLYTVNHNSLRKLDATDGHEIWMEGLNYVEYLTMTSDARPTPIGVMLDSDNNVYVAGTVNGYVPNQTVTNRDILVKKYSQLADMDGDGIPNNEDNCPMVPNTGQSDEDHDGG